MLVQHVPDFHRIILQDKKLRVPKIYVEKYWKGISNPIFLKFPNGVQQKIFWVKYNGDIWFQKNWESFAKPFKYGYLITFKFIGGSYFKVKIFDANTLEISYSNIKSVDECAEATKEAQKSDEEATEEGKESDEESDEEATEEGEESDEESDKVEMPKKAQRTINDKRKFSGSKKVAMVKKARKYQTSEAVNENPFFVVIMTQSYTNGYFLWLPCEFSREHLENFNGTATIRVGNERSVEVSLRYYGNKERSCLGGGWKIFREKYNLQVDDVCKFEMIRRRPFSFIVTITRAGNEAIPNKLLEGPNVMKHNTFKVLVKNTTPGVPKEFMKRGCHENIVELKMGRKSWFVKVNYYESIHGCRFSKGWTKFMKECKVKIGDTCLFRLIDERKFVFDVSI